LKVAKRSIALTTTWQPQLKSLQLIFLFSFCLLLWGSPGLCDVGVATPVGDNMVLQADADPAIWGSAKPEEKITITFAGKTFHGAAQPDGRWTIHLGKLKAGTISELSIQGENQLLLKNVAVGEVWICSGQSNMTFTLDKSLNSETTIAEADNPNIRLFIVASNASNKPLDYAIGNWAVCSPKSCKNFSAVGYYFARDLQKKLGVPIGIIESGWGGTTAQAWMSPESLAANLDFAAKFWIKPWSSDEKLKLAMDNFQRKSGEWLNACARAENSNLKMPQRPPLPNNIQSVPSGLFNAMIKPLTPMTIRGVIWYQGESNAYDPITYRKLFPALISDWREHWHLGDFPFLFVQLPNFAKAQPNSWPLIREAQLLALHLPETAMVTTIELGNPNDIHPRNKEPVGERLALAALNTVYKENIEASGPMFDHLEVQGSNLTCHFKHAENLRSKPASHVIGFEISGADHSFVKANATIEGEKVVLNNPLVREPLHVRYGWDNSPDCNLYNGSGLPASPFRSDGPKD
jgi:sialate O-acetylesterase